MHIDVRLSTGGALRLDADQITVAGGLLAFWRASTLLAEITDSDVTAIALGSGALAVAGVETDASYSVAVIRETYPNAYARWTAREDARLLESHARHEPVARIAASHGRQESAIRSRIRKLLPDLLEDEDSENSDIDTTSDASARNPRAVRFV